MTHVYAGNGTYHPRVTVLDADQRSVVGTGVISSIPPCAPSPSNNTPGLSRNGSGGGLSPLDWTVGAILTVGVAAIVAAVLLRRRSPPPPVEDASVSDEAEQPVTDIPAPLPEGTERWRRSADEAGR